MAMYCQKISPSLWIVMPLPCAWKNESDKKRPSNTITRAISVDDNRRAETASYSPTVL